MNQSSLKNILSAKFDFNVWKELLDKFFPKVDFFTSIATITDSLVKSGGQVGNIHLDDGRSLAIFCFEVADNVQISRNRKSLRDIAAKYVDQGLIHGALVFYYSQNQDDYRLTFVAKQTYFNENGELVKKETAPKRYTFLLGKNESCTTAASRLLELANKKELPKHITEMLDELGIEPKKATYVGELFTDEAGIHYQVSYRIAGIIIDISNSDDENISVYLDKVPSNRDKIVFVLNIYKCIERRQTFGGIDNLYIRLYDPDSKKALVEYRVTGNFKNDTALVIGMAYRKNGAWVFRAIGKGTRASSVSEVAKDCLTICI